MYVWSKRRVRTVCRVHDRVAYWCTNLPYFPSLLYFAAGNLLFVGGASWQALSSSSTVLHGRVAGRPARSRSG